jgi:multidrug efflux system outer membrane protein
LLERRPDVQRQAQALDAALARLGIARHEVYPRLQIEWAGRRERMAVQGAQIAPQWTVATGVALTMPIFDGGRIRANIAIHEARAQEAMAEYEKALLAALVEGETALAGWSAAQETLQRSRSTVESSASALQRSQRLFDAGLVDAGAALEVRRVLLRAQDARLRAAAAVREAAVTLRRAFAGAV